MKVRLVADIVAPDGATHYSGNLLEEQTWWKLSGDATDHRSRWCYWNAHKKDWYVHSEHRPHWIKEIQTENYIEV